MRAERAPYYPWFISVSLEKSTLLTGEQYETMA